MAANETYHPTYFRSSRANHPPRNLRPGVHLKRCRRTRARSSENRARAQEIFRGAILETRVVPIRSSRIREPRRFLYNAPIREHYPAFTKSE